MTDNPGYRLWRAEKIGREEYWSWERADGKGGGGNYPSKRAAEGRAIESLQAKPLDVNRAKALRRHV